MRSRKPILGAALLFLASAGSAAQAPVPVDKEPRHHLKFENKYARVFDVVVPPGKDTLYHIHSADYVFVMIGDATLKPQVFGADPTNLTLKNGEARFSTAPLTHRVTNVAKTTFRNITVEVLGSPGATGDAPPLDTVPGHKMILQNEKVRVERLLLEPGQSTGVHSHNLAELAVVVSGGKLLIEGQGQKPQEADFKPGEFRWSEGARSHSVKNIGRARFEAVTVEWK